MTTTVTPDDGEDDFLSFLDEDGGAVDGAAGTPPAATAPWKVLVVDDDAEVHAITKVVLGDFSFEGRELAFYSAYSAAEGRRFLDAESDIAVVLLDVVMETDDAGLRLVRYIRKELENQHTRIILRTGQPGQAPERQVIVDFDINDYKSKGELTAQKLFTSVVAALRSYQHIASIEQSRRGLEKIIEASSSLVEERNLSRFVEGVLMQLRSLVQNVEGSILCTVQQGDNAEVADFAVLAGSGPFAVTPGTTLSVWLPQEVLAEAAEAVRSGENVYRDDYSIIVFRSQSHTTSLVYQTGHGRLGRIDRGLLEIFCTRVAVAFDNLNLYDQVIQAQKATVQALGKLAEFKDEITGDHVRRVERISNAIARELHAHGLFGDVLDDIFLDQIGLASILHDVGKVAISDRILRKPGRLDEEEMAAMRLHTVFGSRILREVSAMVQAPSYLSLGAEVADSHHEKFDGTGYPNGTKGEAIPLSGRIVAVADVYDALLHKRPYKEAWAIAETVDYIRQQAGKHFDPVVVDAFLAVMKRGDLD